MVAEDRVNEEEAGNDLQIGCEERSADEACVGKLERRKKKRLRRTV